MRKAKKATGDAPAIVERLLTLREVAEVLRLNPRTVREYVRRGEIEGRIIGGRWRFARVDSEQRKNVPPMPTRRALFRAPCELRTGSAPPRVGSGARFR